MWLRCGLLVLGVVCIVRRPEAAETYEVRQYLLGDGGNAAVVDDYLQNALLPALSRVGVGPVGVLHPHASDQMGIDAIFVIIPYQDANQVDTVRRALMRDTEYQSAATQYLTTTKKTAAYQRIRSELLVAMDCWPNVTVSNRATSNPDRVFELRLYESSNERLGDLKVDMFNSGEVPIFLDCGIQPIFIGQCILGPQMPSLTYLTTYESEEARLAAWKAFPKHPDWQTLKVVPKYRGTVSHIDKFVLQPKSYSQM